MQPPNTTQAPASPAAKTTHFLGDLDAGDTSPTTIKPIYRILRWVAGVLVVAALVTLALPKHARAADARAAERPLTIIVPFPAGGPTDRAARPFAVALSKSLGGQPVIIENIGGAGGTLGAAKVARASADGLTILMHHIGMSAAPAQYRKLPYNTLEDFEYLGLFEEVPMTLVGREALPASFTELQRWMRKQGSATTLAHSGTGSASHLCGLLLQNSLKQQMNTVPYKGTGPAMMDVLGGRIDVMCDQITNTSEHIIAGKVKAYAVTTPARVRTSTLKSLPTLTELGLEGAQITSWLGLYAPKGTPRNVLERLNGALRNVVTDPAFVASQESMGASIVTDARLSPQAHKRFVASEIERWTPLIQAAQAYAD